MALKALCTTTTHDSALYAVVSGYSQSEINEAKKALTGRLTEMARATEAVVHNKESYVGGYKAFFRIARNSSTTTGSIAASVLWGDSATIARIASAIAFLQRCAPTDLGESAARKETPLADQILAFLKIS